VLKEQIGKNEVEQEGTKTDTSINKEVLNKSTN
jgi:hypothetical protein